MAVNRDGGGVPRKGPPKGQGPSGPQMYRPTATGVPSAVGYQSPSAAGETNSWSRIFQDPLNTGFGHAKAQADFLAQFGPGGPLAPSSPQGGPTVQSAADAAAKAQRARQMAALSGVAKQVQTGGAADLAAAQAAMANYDQYAQGLSDPYANVAPAAQVQVDPSALSRLITDQGGGDAGLQAQAQFLQASNGAVASQADRLVQLLSAGQQAWNQSSRTAGKLAGQQTEAEIRAQIKAMLASIGMQKAAL